MENEFGLDCKSIPLALILTQIGTAPRAIASVDHAISPLGASFAIDRGAV